MKYNYWKLIGKMKDEKITQNDLAKYLKRNPATISKKLRGQAVFNQQEIGLICSLLNIPTRDVAEYFFTC